VLENSPEIEKIVKDAAALAIGLNHEFVTTEHLALALMNNTNFIQLLIGQEVDVAALATDMADYVQNKMAHIVKLNQADSPLKTHALERVFNRAYTQALFKNRKTLETVDLFLSITKEANCFATYLFTKYGVDSEKIMQLVNKKMRKGGKQAAGNQQVDAILAEYCTDLNAEAEAGKIDPVIGRDNELTEIAQILARRNKNNVLMVGDPGVGKTAIAEGLAQNIVNKTVPKFLEDWRVYNLDIGTLLAGSKFRGEFEQKVREVIDALAVKGKSILFIDEAHQMRGAGAGGHSEVDFSNMLKPALSKGKIKVIASTTWEEYTGSFEKDRALMRRFHRLTVDEPNPAHAKEILHGLKSYFEKFHSARITDEAINAAVDLSVRYQTDKKLPDKALDLIDSACARQRVKDAVDFEVTKAMVIDELSAATKVPISQLSDDNKDMQLDMDQRIKDKLYGQDEAVDKVLEKVYIAKAGLKAIDKPVGVFLFAGPTGVGKTELCKLLSNTLGMKLLRYDMSEYQEKHSVSRLIGAPPGYVGYDDTNLGGGLLISDVSKNPNSIILFDEIEKAHPDATTILLQLMDEGSATGSNGKKVDARNCLIVMTSNLGSAQAEKAAFGFTGNRGGEEETAMKDFFAPEFRNRIDAVINFKKLDQLSLRKIVGRMQVEINELLAERGIKVRVTEKAIDHIIEEGYTPSMGARPLARKFNELIKTPLSRKILFDKIPVNTTLSVDYRDNQMHFEVVEGYVGSDGLVRVDQVEV
jgi:ATP-dependent Clp protease ATP-binding subunit ClpA